MFLSSMQRRLAVVRWSLCDAGHWGEARRVYRWRKEQGPPENTTGCRWVQGLDRMSWLGFLVIGKTIGNPSHKWVSGLIQRPLPIACLAVRNDSADER